MRTMYLENVRAILQGILILIFAAVAYWINLSVGLVLVAILGVLILQSGLTDWCPADLFLRALGLTKKLESKR
jgi:hypothetical protein